MQDVLRLHGEVAEWIKILKRRPNVWEALHLVRELTKIFDVAFNLNNGTENYIQPNKRYGDAIHSLYQNRVLQDGGARYPPPCTAHSGADPMM